MKTFLILFILMSSTLAKQITPLINSKIQPRLNIINGASTECVMHHFYINSGWTQIEGEVGRNGIDGLYYKKKDNTIKEVLVAESKWNSSRLGFSGKNKTVKQMSQEWVLRTMDKLVKKMDTATYRTLRKLISYDQYRARLFKLKPIGDNSIQKHKPLPEYSSIKKLIENDQYRARLFKVIPVCQERIRIDIYTLKNKGQHTFDTFVERKLDAINLKTPKNSFERNMVKAYNTCRATALH